MDEEDERIEAWEHLARHPFFRECYDVEAPLLHTMLERLDGLMARADHSAADVKQAEEPVEYRISRAFVNGYREGMERASRGRLDNW